MRQLAGYVVVGALIAAALYLGVEIAVGPDGGEARPDFSPQSVLVFGLIVAVLLACLVAVGAEVRHLIDRHRGPPAGLSR